MRSTFLCSILLLLSFLAQAQGPQQLVTVPIGIGQTAPGWLYLPADYATSNKKYPVIFFYHGIGEAGTNPYTLLSQGLPNLIANGMRPDNITNPVDGQQYSFIVLSVQHWSWSPSPDWLPFEIDWLQQNYRIDTTRIYATGMSAGGQRSFASTVSNPAISRLIAAAVPMSPATVTPIDSSLIAQYSIKTWFFSGSTDGGYTQNATSYSQMCNNQLPGSSRLNIYSGGHCCWNTFYNTSWRDAGSNLSIYEWMLTNRRTIANNPLPVAIANVRATDLGGRRVRVDFTANGQENGDRFFVKLIVKGRPQLIEVTAADRTGTNTYSKIINLNQ